MISILFSSALLAYPRRFCLTWLLIKQLTLLRLSRPAFCTGMECAKATAKTNRNGRAQPSPSGVVGPNWGFRMTTLTQHCCCFCFCCCRCRSITCHHAVDDDDIWLYTRTPRRVCPCVCVCVCLLSIVCLFSSHLLLIYCFCPWGNSLGTQICSTQARQLEIVAALR